jgi:tripartite-type tricarboxylate transporter receptor subunit TctC
MNRKTHASSLQKTFQQQFAFATAIGVALAAQGALAQDWPSKPISLVVPFPAGGSNDVVARLVGESVRKRLGQAVLVDNKPGANGSLGVETTLRTAKDQHTFLVASDSVSLLPLFRTMPWDLTKTFTPVSVLSFQPIVVVTAPSQGFKSIQDLQARAKGKARSSVLCQFGARLHSTLGGRIVFAKLRRQPASHSLQGWRTGRQ